MASDGDADQSYGVLVFGQHLVHLDLASMHSQAQGVRESTVIIINTNTNFIIISCDSLNMDSSGSVVLDCQFEMDEHRDRKAVLKWYHKGDPVPIYQWIISKENRKYSDKIEPFVDKNYSIGDKLTKFRAIRLISPPMSLSGEYECTVQSIDGHDIKTTELIIYVTAKNFTIKAIEVDNGVNISCEGTGLSPEPKLALFRITQTNESNGINAIEVKDKTTTSLSREESGLYNISLTAQVYEDSYSSGIDVTDHYECRLMIEKTDYMETRNLAIQSDKYNTKENIEFLLYRLAHKTSFAQFFAQQIHTSSGTGISGSPSSGSRQHYDHRLCHIKEETEHEFI
ncbi:unnamed protein product [Oppiella nova]|uniref:Ig-like domain-containing protein n=1 Tax=Oppiella nova TaxID=334625 RepID=A0A7R9L9B3_9ACAR|nr:unnamed protein product [Oppiella nova]CAG2160556.1 unnamed protein product [Oppiella nova]